MRRHGMQLAACLSHIPLQIRINSMPLRLELSAYRWSSRSATDALDAWQYQNIGTISAVCPVRHASPEEANALQDKIKGLQSK